MLDSIKILLLTVWSWSIVTSTIRRGHNRHLKYQPDQGSIFETNTAKTKVSTLRPRPKIEINNYFPQDSNDMLTVNLCRPGKGV
jgi:hypothetical protein